MLFEVTDFPTGNFGSIASGLPLGDIMEGVAQDDMVAQAVAIVAAQVPALEAGEWLRIQRNDPGEDYTKGLFTITLSKKVLPDG